MTLKTERAVNEAVTRLNASKWDKMKKWSRRALLAAVSTISIAAGMVGTSQQMQAQNPQVIEVSVNDLGAYLNANRGNTAQAGQQQYAQVYANRDNYRRQHQQAAYASPQWLEENGLEYDAKLSRNLNWREYLGAYIDWNCVDRYGMPTHVVYLPQNPRNRPVRINMDDAQKMCKHPGGDALSIYCSPTGTDINNPENNPSWDGDYHESPRGRKVRRVLHNVDNAVRTAHNLYHIIKGGR